MGREQFQRALEDLRRETAAMAVQVESQINRALQVMQQPDSEVAVNIQAEDQAINEFCRRLREHGFQIIATQQPVAGDLRAIMGVSSIAIELERMGDYAVRLARRSGILAEPPQHPLPPHFARMGELATAMV
ncbi:MAG: phosphate signaling complex PhoU family protein, partial [Candidatus Dormibacteraceae bacterium]